MTKLPKSKSPDILQNVVAFDGDNPSSSALLCFRTSNVTTESINCQYISDESEVREKFTPKKLLNDYLASSYSRLGYERKAEVVSSCGSFLEFATPINPDGSFGKSLLHSADFCRDRLCPMCSWRRSYKIFGQVSQIMEHMDSEISYIFVTFTIRSVPGQQLRETISRMLKAFDKLCKRKRFQDGVVGFFRALEITRNQHQSDAAFGLYHPHFHCVFAVETSYFGRNYIRQNEWLRMWQECYGDNSISFVNVEKCYNKSASDINVVQLSSAVAEAAKYAVKPSAYIFNDPDEMDVVVSDLCEALYHRRLVSFGGIFKEIFAKLNLDDPEDGDLIHLDGNLNPMIEYLIRHYSWNVGTYQITSEFIHHATGEILPPP